LRSLLSRKKGYYHATIADKGKGGGGKGGCLEAGERGGEKCVQDPCKGSFGELLQKGDKKREKGNHYRPRGVFPKENSIPNVNNGGSSLKGREEKRKRKSPSIEKRTANCLSRSFP